MKSRVLVLFAAIALAGTPPVRAQAASLPALAIDVQQTSVSGLSSGGYMAVQFHVANSAIVKGAGVVAGGPYFCAKDDQNIATSVCSCTGLGACQSSQASQMVANLVQLTNQFANQGAIDATANLSNSRVWLFSGSADSVVPTAVMNALEAYYKTFVAAANITFRKDIPAEHAMPTDRFGNACGFKGDPFINDCNFDAAGEILKSIYGNLNARSPGALGGQFIEFDQGEFLANPTAHGMSQTGWAYVPASCQQNAPCKLHVVFHGCKQYPGSAFASGPQGRFGDTYVKNAGYNSWADSNGMVILYPQANAMTVNTRLPRSNPNGCWDWWGYDDAAYAKKAGRQMAAVRGMVDRLAGIPGSMPVPATGFCGRSTNSAHASASPSRAYSRFLWWYFARGSNDFLGFGATETTLKEDRAGSFRKVTSCP